VFFQDALVPKENLVGKLNDGWRITLGSLAHERGGLWVQGVATVENALQRLIELAKKSGQDRDPTVRRRIAHAYEQVSSLRALGYKGFASFAKGGSAPEHSYLKLATSELGKELFELGTELEGAAGVVVDPDYLESGGYWIRASSSASRPRSRAGRRRSSGTSLPSGSSACRARREERPMAGFETLLYEEKDGVAWVTLNRPDVYNAFNAKMQGELHELWRGLRRNDDVRCIVLTGAGDKAFCTGIDRAETMGDYRQGRRQEGAGGRCADAIHVRRPGREHRTEELRPVEAGDRRRQRHRLRRRLLHARRGRVHHRHGGCHVFRPARDLRHDGVVRAHAHAAEDAVPRDHEALAAR